MALKSVSMNLSRGDHLMLSGAQGAPRKFAMQMLQRVAQCVGAARLIDISQAHLVGAYYGGPASLRFVEKLLAAGADVAVPTTLNASSADLYQDTLYDADRRDVKNSCRIVKCYQDMGCSVELTCAPYHLPEVPGFGEAIAWAESNAIVYANSVIGARTNKTFQYLDLSAALTGRIPEFGFYCTEARRAVIVYRLVDIPETWFREDAFYQLLGLWLGANSGNDVPVIEGIPAYATRDQMRGLGASAAASGNLAMFHAVGLTPEAPDLDTALQHRSPMRVDAVTVADIIGVKDKVSTVIGGQLSAVCLGTPHFSIEEFYQVLHLLDDRRVALTLDFYITTSRHVFEKLKAARLLETLCHAGVQVVTDTCTYHGALLKNRPGIVMTASGKWAWYAPGNLGVEVKFATLPECVNSAVSGEVECDGSFWRC